MDFPSKQELIANQLNNDLEKLRQFLGVDSVEYLSLEKMHESVPQHTAGNGKNLGYCDACFSGNYPIPIEYIEKLEFEKE